MFACNQLPLHSKAWINGTSALLAHLQLVSSTFDPFQASSTSSLNPGSVWKSNNLTKPRESHVTAHLLHNK